MTFTEFAKMSLQRVLKMYEERRPSPSVPPRSQIVVPEALKEFNSRFCILLLPAVPEKTKKNVLQDEATSDEIRAVTILDP